MISKHVQQGYKPIIVCSAMGKTTNSLLIAGESALNQLIDIKNIRNLHLSTVKSLQLSPKTTLLIESLLNELEKLLEGIKTIGELTLRTKDLLVSFGERLSVRIISANLIENLSLNSQYYDAWNIGIKTTSDFGNGEVSSFISFHSK